VCQEAGDFRETDAAVAHQADQPGPQLARSPAVADVGLGADAFEHLPDVGRVQFDAVMGGEDQPGVLLVVAGGEPFGGPAFGPRPYRLDRYCVEAEGAADRSVLAWPKPTVPDPRPRRPRPPDPHGQVDPQRHFSSSLPSALSRKGDGARVKYPVGASETPCHTSYVYDVTRL
jgi:hypothetical protein